MNNFDPTAKKKITLKAFMAPSRKVETKYLRRPPASAADVPEGKVVAHNNVVPVTAGGMHGSRAWTQLPDEGIEVCPCDWAPHLGKHYRVRLAPSSN